jgi:GNAT superfamily N-acetyltransferase
MERCFFTSLSSNEKYSIYFIKDQIEVGFLTIVVPTDVSLNKLIQTEKRQSYIKWWKENVFKKPYVDFSYIEKEYRNKGFGKKLYKIAAIWLKIKFGLKLWASQNQSKEAKRLWKSLSNNTDPLFVANNESLEFLGFK